MANKECFSLKRLGRAKKKINEKLETWKSGNFTKYELRKIPQENWSEKVSMKTKSLWGHILLVSFLVLYSWGEWNFLIPNALCRKGGNNKDRKGPKNDFSVRMPLWGIRLTIWFWFVTESSINKKKQLCEFIDLATISEK